MLAAMDTETSPRTARRVTGAFVKVMLGGKQLFKIHYRGVVAGPTRYRASAAHALGGQLSSMRPSTGRCLPRASVGKARARRGGPRKASNQIRASA